MIQPDPKPLGFWQFSLWHLFYATAAAGVVLGMWKICVQPAIDSGGFQHMKTYREVQIERGKQAMERRKNEQLIP